MLKLIICGQYFVGIVGSDEVVDGTQCHRDLCLDVEIEFWSQEENPETLFQDTKNVFDDVARRRMTKVK